MTATLQYCVYPGGDDAPCSGLTTCQHCQRMLKSQDQGQHNGDAIFEPEEGCRLAGLFGEGDSGGKEIGVVIIANEAVTDLMSLDL